ncbi:CU044_5270 family protein [Streptosporangium fragile]|uniref:CU044_5270 family protein n=1 Tax=Streptosporangium fragile TaxID=46186 RepID=UPI0031E8EEC3
MDDPQERFTGLYDRHYRGVLGYALLRAEHGVAEDVSSETFLIAWRRLDELPDPPLPWLLGVTRNLLAKQRDSRHRRQALVDRIAALTTSQDHLIWDIAEHVVDRDTALAVLAALPEQDVEVMALATWHGLPPDQAATVMGCSTRTYNVRLHRARKRLGRALRTEAGTRAAQLRPRPSLRGGLMSYPPRRSREEPSCRASKEEDMTDRMFARLKPVELDELTDEAYRRRRSDDLARAFRTPRSPQPTRRFTMPRRPFLITATVAAAGLAAAVIAVPGLVSGDSSPGGTPAAVPRTSQAVDAAGSQPLDARSFLLAAAETAAREPASSGRYWYTRERVFEKIRVAEGEYTAEAKALLKEWEATQKALKDKPEELKAATEEFEKKSYELKTSQVPYDATAAYTKDFWRAREKGATSRTVGNQDVKITFRTPEDEAKWKEAGSPVLRDDRPRTGDDTTERVLSIDNPGLNVRNVAELPTGKKDLERRLRSLYGRKPSGGGGKATFDMYLWQTGLDLMAAPITPGTRSALFQVLAGQSGLRSQGTVTDALGRAGVALTTSDTSEEGTFEFRLILDEKTAELLEYSVAEQGESSPLVQVAYEDMGWVDRLGERPRD